MARGAELRLVAISGYGQPLDRQRAQAAGFDAHLVKPVDTDHLRTVLAELTPASPPPAMAVLGRCVSMPADDSPLHMPSTEDTVAGLSGSVLWLAEKQPS